MSEQDNPTSSTPTDSTGAFGMSPSVQESIRKALAASTGLKAFREIAEQSVRQIHLEVAQAATDAFAEQHEETQKMWAETAHAVQATQIEAFQEVVNGMVSPSVLADALEPSLSNQRMLAEVIEELNRSLAVASSDDTLARAITEATLNTTGTATATPSSTTTTAMEETISFETSPAVRSTPTIESAATTGVKITETDSRTAPTLESLYVLHYAVSRVLENDFQRHSFTVALTLALGVYLIENPDGVEAVQYHIFVDYLIRSATHFHNRSAR